MPWVTITNVRGPRGLRGLPGEPLTYNDGLALTIRQNLMRATDNRTMTIFESDEWSHAIGDVDGHVALGVNHVGEVEITKRLRVADMDVNALDPDYGVGGLDPSSGYLFAVGDKDDSIGFGVREDVGVYTPTTRELNSSDRLEIDCDGDSLVRGYTGGTAWDLADAWPAHLQGLLPGVMVNNRGYGGNTINEVALRLGLEQIYVQPVGGVIPASGAVAVTMAQKPGVVLNREISFNGVLAGVPGALSQDSAGAWTFNRTADGSEVPVSTPKPFGRADIGSWKTKIIWFFRNNVSFDVVGAEGDVLEHGKAATLDYIGRLAVHRPSFLICTVVNQSAEVSGTARYELVMAYNAWLKETFPGRVVDTRQWIVHEAIYALGLAPTPADLSAMAGDAPPPQIMDGGSHPVKETSPFLAQIFATALREKGMVS